MKPGQYGEWITRIISSFAHSNIRKYRKRCENGRYIFFDKENLLFGDVCSLDRLRRKCKECWWATIDEDFEHLLIVAKFQDGYIKKGYHWLLTIEEEWKPYFLDRFFFILYSTVWPLDRNIET